MRVVPGQNGVASESCAVRVSRHVAQQVVMMVPAELVELTEMMHLAEPT